MELQLGVAELRNRLARVKLQIVQHRRPWQNRMAAYFAIGTLDRTTDVALSDEFIRDLPGTPEYQAAVDRTPPPWRAASGAAPRTSSTACPTSPSGWKSIGRVIRSCWTAPSQCGCASQRRKRRRRCGCQVRRGSGGLSSLPKPDSARRGAFPGQPTAGCRRRKALIFHKPGEHPSRYQDIRRSALEKRSRGYRTPNRAVHSG